MASEYGYDPSGSVVGGIGDLLKLKQGQDEQDQQKAAVPFLNQALAKYLGGAQLPNFQALASFVNASQGLSRAGYEGSETAKNEALLPGQVEGQGLENQGRGLENQFAGQSMGQRLLNLVSQGQNLNAESRRSNTESDIAQVGLPFLPQEKQAGIDEAKARTGEYESQSDNLGTESALAPLKLQMQQGEQEWAKDPNNPENKMRQSEAQFSQSRAKNMDAETSMYGGQPGGQAQADPRLAAIAAALKGGGAPPQQKENPGDVGGGLEIPGAMSNMLTPEQEHQLLAQHIALLLSQGKQPRNVGGGLQVGGQ